jgi:MFS family permease
MASNTAVASTPWYRSLNREQWRVLIASNLGWLFDGFEIYAIFLTVGFALHQLLDPSQYAAIPKYAGYILAGTVAGWATGGVSGGIIADYIGRKRTMMLAILAYSLTTGLSAIAWDWPSFLILRFLVGVGIGSEWATGASIVSEMWPDHARGKGGGLLQMGAGIGSVIASLVWLGIGDMGPNAWRWLYLIGVLPALIVLWIRRNIPESPRWEETNERRRFAHAQQQSGALLEGVDAQLTRSTIVDLFTERSVRWRLIGAFLMMLSVTFAFWGVATFIPTYVGSIAAKAGFSAPTLSAWAGLLSGWRGGVRLCLARLLRRSVRPQGGGDVVLPGILGADAGGLSVGPEPHPPASLRRRLRLLLDRHLGMGADLATRTVSHAHARHRDRVLLQRTAFHLLDRPADRRYADR